MKFGSLVREFKEGGGNDRMHGFYAVRCTGFPIFHRVSKEECAVSSPIVRFCLRKRIM